MTREEAIKIASETYGWLKTDREREALETLIPELVESEDERIRKELIGMVKFHCADEHLDRYLNWFEKHKEQEPAELKQGKRIEEGDKVKIHCREDRDKGMLSIYNDKVGEVISIWDAERNPWGPIIVRLDNGCCNGFHEDELDIFDEPRF